MLPVAILWRHRLFTGICYMHVDILPVSFLAVWWGVQRTAGGSGRISKEGRENQRVGREDPGPGETGKSIKTNPITLQNRITSPKRWKITWQSASQSSLNFYVNIRVTEGKNVCLMINETGTNVANWTRAAVVRRTLYPTSTRAAAVSGSSHQCKSIWCNKGPISL